MPFFTPLPAEEAPEPEPRPAFFYMPGQRPQHWVPGVGPAGAVLARTATSAVVLRVDAAYPQGLALTLQVLLHPEHTEDAGPFPRPRRRGWFLPRLGMQWADGRRVESGPGHPGIGEPEAGTFRLSGFGGGGGGLEWLWTLWLTPLPPAEPVDVYVEWERRGIPETRSTMDLSEAVGWADSAVELWPLPGPPEDAGWFAYAPL